MHGETDTTATSSVVIAVERHTHSNRVVDGNRHKVALHAHTYHSFSEVKTVVYGLTTWETSPLPATIL